MAKQKKLVTRTRSDLMEVFNRKHDLTRDEMISVITAMYCKLEGAFELVDRLEHGLDYGDKARADGLRGILEK